MEITSVKQLTKEALEEVLNPFIGKKVEYGGNLVYCKACDIARKINENLGLQPWTGEGCNTSRDGWNIYINYKSHTIAHITIKRQKGYVDGRGIKHYLDYSYKAFDIEAFPYKPEDKTVEEYIDDLDLAFQKVKEKAEREKQDAIAKSKEIIDFIRNKLGVNNRYEAYKLLDFAKNEVYDSPWPKE